MSCVVDTQGEDAGWWLLWEELVNTGTAAGQVGESGHVLGFWSDQF